MIASLSGVISSVGSQSLVVEIGGVGILVHVSPRLAAAYSSGNTVSLQTVLVVREDALTLYGFETAMAKELFEILQTVTGIGPKVAQSALNVYDPNELIDAIRNENLAALERIPGLGKKGASRVLLELKDKVQNFEISATGSNSAENSSSAGLDWRDQLTSALLGLGFSARESAERIDFAVAHSQEGSATPISELLRTALTRGSKS